MMSKVTVTVNSTKTVHRASEPESLCKAIANAKLRCDEKKIRIIQPKSSSAPSRGLSLNQLRFSSLGLYGRRDELSILRRAYSRVREQKARHASRTEVVLITGRAGTGKSSLVHKFRDDMQRSNTRKASGLIDTRSERNGGAGKGPQAPAAFFVEGKFDMAHSESPYSAFVAAFSQLCDGIFALEDHSRLRDAIRTAVGSEGDAITNLIPELKNILGSGNDGAGADRPAPAAAELGGQAQSGFDGKRSRNRFNFIIRRFVRAVSSPSLPLVIFLDDLQRADKASLELLEFLLTDRDLSGLLLVGCYRDEEVHVCVGEEEETQTQTQTQTHPLAMHFREIEKSKSVQMTRVAVENLTAEQVNDLISDLLSEDKCKTLGLASIVHKRTDGNAFFVQQFLASLRDEDMLKYCMGAQCWRWDEDEIRSKTGVSDNVLDLLKERLHKALDHDARSVLQVAACLGASFDEHTIVCAAEAVQKGRGGRKEKEGTEHNGNGTNSTSNAKETKDTEGEDTNTALGWKNKGDSDCEQGPGSDIHIISCLEVCICAGLLEKNQRRCSISMQSLATDTCTSSTSYQYRFVHDHIQQAAFSTIPICDRKLIQLQVGEALMGNLLEDDDREEVLFVAVDLMNQGIDLIFSNGDKRHLLATMNLKAGKRAMETGAFSTAASYLKTGTTLLAEGDARWEKNQYKLSLDLYCLAAEANFCNGELDEMQKFLDTVLGQESVPLSDKLQAYLIQINYLGAQHKANDAVIMGLNVLDQLGVRFPRKPSALSGLRLVWDLFKTKKLLKGRDKDSLLDLPLMDDEGKLQAMRIMDKMISSAYVISPILLGLLILKMVRWSVKYGTCDCSAVAFSFYGTVLCAVLGDQKGGKNFGQFSLSLIEKLGLRETEARVLVGVYSLLEHWASPFHDNLKPMLHGYQVGVETGDVEYACLAITHYCVVSFHTGQSLHLVEANLRAYTQQMKDYGQELSLLCALVTWQAAQNLLGRTENPTILTGEAMDQEVWVRQRNEEGNVAHLTYFHFECTWLAYLFGDYELAWQHVVKCGSIAKNGSSSFCVWRGAFFEGLTALAMAFKTNDKIWKKRARAIMKRFKKWIKGGNVNCLHMLLLLEAEMASLENQREEAKRAYDKAICTAGRHGFLCDKALAYERAGDFSAGLRDTYWATHYQGLAYQGYISWGAHAKADEFSRKHPDLLGDVGNLE